MSTDNIITLLENEREYLIDGIQDDNLDILDEFTPEYIAQEVIVMAISLAVRDVVTHTIKFLDVDGWVKYSIKVNNSYKGFVSVSNDDSTGVSRTEYYPFKFDDDEDSPYAALLNLAEMLSEAWYLFKN